MAEIELTKIKKILLIMMGGIGNMIFLTPTLKAIRDSLPNSELIFLLGPYGAEKVIENSPLFNKKFIIDLKTYRGIRGKIRLIKELRKEKFDLSLTSTGSNPIKSGLLCMLSGIKYRLGENIKGKGFFYNLKIPFNPNLHEVESNIRLVERIGINVQNKDLFIHTTNADNNFAEDIFLKNKLEGKMVIGIHPGSGIHQAGFKRWPQDRFAQLADWMIDSHDCSVILFGGPAEIEMAENINRLMQHEPLTMTGKTTLSQTAALIKKCSLFISNDSGLLHVASAVKTPTISLFGPTDYKKTGAYSDSSIMIRKDLPCSPCYSGKPVRCSHLDCLHLITVDDVKDVVRKKLEKYES
jgi:heptosyltransferase-2